jgi:hypothetical protein
MDLESEILGEHSRRQAERIATWVGRDRKRLSRLIQLFLTGEYRVTQRAAWPISICSDRHPAMVRPYLHQLVRRAQDPGVHDAVRRNVVRILQTANIPGDLLGTVATLCFNYLSDAHAPIAVKASSMTVLGQIAQREPDIGRELRLVIEQQLPFGSAGFRARAKRVLKMIDADPGIVEQ